MDVKTMVIAYLRLNNFDGLFNANAECGCEIDDLAPCDGGVMWCEPGYKRQCGSECEHDAGWHIQRERPAPNPAAFEILGA